MGASPELHEQEPLGPLRERRRRAPGDRSEATARLLALAARSSDEDERKQLQDEVVTLNMALARAVASRYRNRGVAYDDLLQSACVGLVKAVQGFDPRRERDFLAYATPTVAGEVKRHFRDFGWTVRPPRRIQELRADVSGASSQLTQSLGRSPRLREVADLLTVDEEQVIEALMADGCFTPASLDAVVRSDGSETLGEQLSGDDPGLALTEARVMLAPLVRGLQQRDRLIISLRFFQGRTQQEIADEIGVSQMQVSRLLTRILTQLRRELEGDGAAAPAPGSRSSDAPARHG